jgi:predicted glutamine amidotransferase
MEFRMLAETGLVSSSAKELGHRDGWGIVQIDDYPLDMGHRAVEEDGTLEANAAVSKEFDRVVEKIGKEELKGVFLTHLRKASSGKRVRKNTAPFVDDGWAFSHNGTVFEMGSAAVSDSRSLFQKLVKNIGDRNDAVEGIRTTVKQIRDGYRYSSLTFLLSNRHHLYAYREYNENYSQDKEYYALRYAQASESTLIFAQEEKWNLRWKLIPNQSLVVADLNLRLEGPLQI